MLAAEGRGACAGDAVDPLLLHRVVVAVTWSDSRCAAATCTFVTATLFAGDLVDPVFRAA